MTEMLRAIVIKRDFTLFVVCLKTETLYLFITVNVQMYAKVVFVA